MDISYNNMQLQITHLGLFQYHIPILMHMIKFLHLMAPKFFHLLLINLLGLKILLLHLLNLYLLLLMHQIFLVISYLILLIYLILLNKNKTYFKFVLQFKTILKRLILFKWFNQYVQN